MVPASYYCQETPPEGEVSVTGVPQAIEIQMRGNVPTGAAG
jgi:hypothetical protein